MHFLHIETLKKNIVTYHIDTYENTYENTYEKHL